MQLLQHLTPAETCLLTKTSSTKLKELMKLTFFDLLLKQVITSKQEKKVSGRKRYVRTVNYLIKGKNFDTYQPLPHEKVFMDAFSENPDLKVLLKHLVKMAYENTKGPYKYIYQGIRETPYIKGFFKSGFFNNVFARVRLNDEGLNVQTDLLKALDELDNTLPDLIQNDKEKALKALLAIKGNIFLLNRIDFKDMKGFDSTIENVISQAERYSSGSDAAFGDDFLDLWWVFDSYDSFDSSFESHYDDASDSGCWGDSGCSSCSGCGGCGGCGGCS